MAQIEFEDKQSFNPSPLPDVNKCTAENLNEIKDSVNFLYTNPIQPEPLPEQNLTVELMTAGNLSFNPVYDNGVDGVGATLTATANGTLRDTSGTAKIDNVTTPSAGTLIWIKNRTNAIENGAYEITVRGDNLTQYVLTRPDGYNQTNELFPLQVNVLFGNTNKDSVWLQKTVDPVIGVDPIVVSKTGTVNQLLPIRFVDTATSEPLPSYSFDPLTNIITFDSLGYFGSINGCDATLNSNLPNGFTTLLVKDEPDAEINGTYRWINVGSSMIQPSMVRIDASPAQFSKANRIFVVSNKFSTLYSKQYCVEPTTPPLTIANFNTIPINFIEFVGGGGSQTLQQVSDTGGLDNGSTIRLGSENRFFERGISRVCSFEKEIQFVNGVEYYFPVGESIVYAHSMNGDTPDQYYDNTQGFQGGSKYYDARNNKLYACTDASTDNAVWERIDLIDTNPTNASTNPVSSGGVFTALALKENSIVAGTTAQYWRGDKTWQPFPSLSVTVGTTAIASGTVGRLIFQGAGNVIQQDSNLFWDNTNKRLGIGATPNTSTLLDLRAQGALLADTVFRARNSANTNDIFSIRGDESIFIGNTANAFVSFKKQAGGSIRQSFDNAFGDEIINLDPLNRAINVRPGAGRIVIGSSTANGYFGIVGESTGLYKLQSINSSGEEFISLRTNQSSNVSNFVFRDNNGALSQAINNTFTISNINDSYFGFVASNKGNIAIGGNSHPAVGRSTFSIFNGIEPTTTVADSFIAFSKDIVANNAAPHFRTENGDIIRLYKETTAVGSATVASAGAGSVIKTDDTFDGYTIAQIAKALRNLGILA